MTDSQSDMQNWPDCSDEPRHLRTSTSGPEVVHLACGGRTVSGPQNGMVRKSSARTLLF